jgi:outer membrane protein
MKQTRPAAMAIAAALACGNTWAQQAGDWQVGAGWMHFAPQDSSQPLVFTAPVPAVLPGTGAGVSNADTLGLSLLYFVDSHWAVEGVIGIPPKFKLDGIGGLAPIGQLGEARQWSPTLLAKYYFLAGDARLRPFVGLGGTYVWYSSVNITPGLQGALAQQIGAPVAFSTTTGKIDSSFAPVFNVGAAWQFNPQWGVSFSVSYIPLKTTAKLTTRVLGVPVAASQASVKLDPIVTYLALTYKF